MADVKKKAYKEALAEFRKKHLPQLEKTIQVWIDIRDDEEAKDKDRSEAGKNIARLLAAMQVDKAPASKQSDTTPAQKPKATDKELEELDDIINAP